MTPTKTKRTRRHLIHFVATCNNCKWTTQNYLSGPRAASSHAYRTGHYVLAEYGYYRAWNATEGHR